MKTTPVNKVCFTWGFLIYYTDFLAGEYQDSADSDSDSETTIKHTSGKSKPQKLGVEDEPLDYTKYDSIQGEGGLIKTRSQRQQELAKEKEFQLTANSSTIDVDSVWASMKGDSQKSSTESAVDIPKVSTPISFSDSTSAPGLLKDEYITIKRVYNFAGKVTTEEKQVLASSAEGKAYVAESKEQDSVEYPKQTPNCNNKRSSLPTKKRVVKRKKSSMLEELAKGKAKKLNTLEKSRLDWLGYVDQQGIKDDLSQHNKDGYLQKQDFLRRVERRVDDDWKQFKKK